MLYLSKGRNAKKFRGMIIAPLCSKQNKRKMKKQMLGEFELNKIYCMDCLEGLKKVPDNSVDLVVTDPPYNIGKDFENDNLPEEEYLEWCKKWIKELVRVCKIGGAIYLTLGFQCVAEIKCLFNKFETLRLKNWIVWYRQDGWKSDKGFGHSHEHILYFIKDNVPFFNLEEFGKHIKERRLMRIIWLCMIIIFLKVARCLTRRKNDRKRL